MAEAQLAVQLDALRRRKLALLLFELQRDVEQSLLHTLRRHRLGQKREMVPEHQDRDGIVDLGVFPHELLEEDCGHRGHVFVAEADVGEHEPFVTGLHRGHADLALCGIDDPAPRENLLAERHRARRRLGRMEHDLALQAGHVVIEQAAVLDDAAGDLAFARRECGERDIFAAFDLVQDREVGRRQHAEVLAVLAIDALDAFGDHELDAGAHLGVGRLLAR